MLASDRMLARLFGVALAAHVIGNWHQPDLPSLVGIIELLVGLLGIALVVVPTRPIWLIAAGATVLSVIGEIPQTGNHWLLAGLASLVILLTRGAKMLAGLRWLLVVFYAFAAFAKLNSGFFDPTASCAVFYANQSLSSWGFSELSTDSVAATVAVWSSALIELTVVPLLMWNRTRWLGIVVGSVFHGLISLDLDQHFYDFTAVLFFLFAAFLPPSDLETVTRNSQLLSWARWIGACLAFALVVLSVLPTSPVTASLLSDLPFLLWVPFLLWWIGFILRRREAVGLEWRLAPATALVVVLAFLNGLTPYVELKTAYSFNMYSNLLTAEGETNHLLIPRTFPMRDGYDGPVEIVETSDPGLDLYREREYLIAFPQYQQYLVGRSVSVTYIREGATTTIADTQSIPGLATSGPWWWRFMPLRALDQQSPPRCQDVFLPAL